MHSGIAPRSDKIKQGGKRMRKIGHLLAALLGLPFVFAHSPVAAQSTPFYKGKQLNFLINFAPGGATDIDGRFLAKHLQRFIEGNPTIIIRNMDGGGGLVGANYLGEVAAPDGFTLGYMSGAAWEAASDPKPRRVPFESYDFVAYQPGASIYYARRDISPGLKTNGDFVNAKGVIAGGLGAAIAKDLTIRLTLDTLGIPFRYVTGYKGNQGARMALQQKEINLYNESLPAFKTVVEPLVTSGEVLPLYYDPQYDGAKFVVTPEAATLGLETFPDYYRRVKGKDPQGQHWEAYKSVIALSITMQRLIAFPPNSPPEAKEAIRAAFAKMEQDPLYREEAMKTFGIVPAAVFDANVQERIRKALYVPPEMKKWMADYVANPPR
jgi:tripartite-type tricarboxylate transporter receptor subunit TctC